MMKMLLHKVALHQLKLKAHVPHDGKIFEVYSFQFLCSCELPGVSYFTYPTINWVTVSDGHLPPNAVAGGVAPNGEVLYVGRGNYPSDIIPGYIVPSEKCLHVSYFSQHCQSYDYEVLTIEEQDSFEWGLYFDGEVSSNAIKANTSYESLYIGRTVTASDISKAATWEDVPINLPPERVANTQLIGHVNSRHKCMYVPWDGKEIIYQSYEVLMLKLRPKKLKDLCCNVIITATMGLSHKIDKLPIPVSIRDILKDI